MVSADGIAFAAAWITAWGVRVLLEDVGVRPLNPDIFYWRSLPLILAGSMLTAAAVGSYGFHEIRGPLDEGVRVLKSALGSLLVVMSLAFLFKEFDFSRTVVLLFGGFSLVYLPMTRRLGRLFQERLVKLGLLGTRVLILGAGATGIRALQKVQDHPEIGYRVVGFLDDDPDKSDGRVGRTSVLGGLSQLREQVLAQRVDEVIIAIPAMEADRLMDLVMEIDDLPVKVRVVADLFGVLSHETRIDLIEDVPIYDLEGPDESALYGVSKRLFDLVVAIPAGLLFLLLLPFLAAAIRLDSQGPIFFVHDRVGKDGDLFRMWKFRTMAHQADPYAVAPREESDTRVTRVGRFLRKTSLDELPQVINVIRGEMSLVGPRPEMPFIVAEYNEWQRKRLDVKPGITGLWQILGRKDLPLHENLEYDFYYIKNRTLLLDLIILFKTVPATLFGRGAY